MQKVLLCFSQIVVHYGLGFLDAVALFHDLSDKRYFVVGYVVFGQQGQKPVFSDVVFERENKGQGAFVFFDVVALWFTGELCGFEVEQVVANLEGDADILTKEVGFVVKVCSVGCECSTYLAAGGHKECCFLADYLAVDGLVGVVVAALLLLQQFTFAHLDYGMVDDLGYRFVVYGIDGLHYKGEVVVAKEDGGFVAPEMVDCGDAASDIGLVNYIVVDEGACVKGLDGGHSVEEGVGRSGVVWKSAAAGAQEG